MGLLAVKLGSRARIDALAVTDTLNSLTHPYIQETFPENAYLSDVRLFFYHDLVMARGLLFSIL